MKYSISLFRPLLLAAFFCFTGSYPNIAAANLQAASSNPPGGLKPEQAPQFVVIGFDDNILASGMDWARELYAGRKNPPGNGNPATYDGVPARTSFYMNTEGLTQWLNDNPIELLSSLKRLLAQGHELGNHTHNHHADLKPANWPSFEKAVTRLEGKQWEPRVQECSLTLENKLNLPASSLGGFRAPYLLYNQALFDKLKQQGFVYDCSIEEGHDPRFDGTNFRWPYTLDKGSPGHQENWASHKANPNRVTLKGTSGLWELPNHALLIPDDKACADYGLKPGLWERMRKRLPHLRDRRITGFDYNLWVSAKVSKQEFVGILKYNLDLRLKGNRAPLMFGAHTQYYTDPKWAPTNAPQTNLQEMQDAIREFIDYALSKPMVRLRPARDIIEWCKNPVPLEGKANPARPPQSTPSG